MGVNILNMGVIGGFVGFYGYQTLIKANLNRYASAGVAAWLACFIASLAAAVEMAIAGTFSLVPGLIAMGTYHAAIGIIEGIITAAAIYFIAIARPPDMITESSPPSEAVA